MLGKKSSLIPIKKILKDYKVYFLLKLNSIVNDALRFDYIDIILSYKLPSFHYIL